MSGATQEQTTGQTAGAGRRREHLAVTPPHYRSALDAGVASCRLLLPPAFFSLASEPAWVWAQVSALMAICETDRAYLVKYADEQLSSPSQFA